MELINRLDAIKAMDELEQEDIEKYGCSIPERFDGERARFAICLLPKIQAVPIEELQEIREEIMSVTSRYSISKERCGMGQVEWSDRLIKESDVLEIIDTHIKEYTNEIDN